MRGAFAVAVVVCLAPALAQAGETLPPGRPVCGLQPPGGEWNGAAQWIAGLSDSAFSASLTEEQHAAWNDFSKHSSADWSKLRRQFLDRIEDWRSRNLPNAGSSLVFYPFGGPDALDLLAFFPDAQDYVMVGLEPAGCIPVYVAGYTPDYYADLRRGLSDDVRMGFFVTANLRRNVTHTELNGVLPLLLFFLSRSGYTVNTVTSIAISPEGVSGPSASMASRETRGIAIQFSDSRHRTRTLSYYSVDLTDGALRRKPGSTKYLGSLQEPATMLKAASYLMHGPNFSIIRDMILSQSRVVLEEDSGIPYRFFTPDAWRVRLFGKYSGPSQLFRQWVQPDLKSAYAGDAVQPLNFAIGYRHKGDANLLLAFRK